MSEFQKSLMVLLKDSKNPAGAEKYVSYCQKLKTEVDRDGKSKNPFMSKLSAEKLAELYKRVESEGLEFDGKHVTLQSTGISYDYVAYKNKMILVYPESEIIADVVKTGDTFNFSNENGKITYKHEIKDPFVTADDKSILGAYAIIKNKRGEFLTLLSKEEIEKHRKVAKTDFIWKQWFKEMTMKTVMKKACKFHFDDVFSTMEETDNENYDLDNPLSLEIKYKSEIDSLSSIQLLNEYYSKHKGLGKDFDSYIAKRKEELENENS